MATRTDSANAVVAPKRIPRASTIAVAKLFVCLIKLFRREPDPATQNRGDVLALIIVATNRITITNAIFHTSLSRISNPSRRSIK